MEGVVDTSDFRGRVWSCHTRDIEAVSRAVLAHQAPATEDEAAEVEWGIRDRNDFTMPVQDEAYARQAAGDLPDHWTAVCRTPAGPWREAQS